MIQKADILDIRFGLFLFCHVLPVSAGVLSNYSTSGYSGFMSKDMLGM